MSTETARRIIAAAAEVFGTTREDILSKTRAEPAVTARLACLWYVHACMGWGFRDIDSAFARTAGTARNAYTATEDRLTVDAKFAAKTHQLRNRLADLEQRIAPS